MLKVKELEKGSEARKYADACGIAEAGALYMPAAWHEDYVRLVRVYQGNGCRYLDWQVRQDRIAEIFDVAENANEES